MAMGDKKKTEQQTKEVMMECQQESGESSTPSGERKNATEPQDGHQRFQSKQVLALEETGADNNHTVALVTVNYKPKEMQQKYAAEAEKSLTPGMTSQKECDDICGKLISMITSELKNEWELSERVSKASQYTSQCDANIQQLSIEFAKLAHEIGKVFSKQEIQIQELHRLSSMLGNLEEKMNIEGHEGNEASTIRGVMIPMIRNELKNKEKLCELLYHLTQYTSQYPTDIQQTRPELRKFADEVYQVFSRPKNLAQGIDGLLPMLENLQKRRKIEDADEDLLWEEDMPVVQLEKPCDPKARQQFQHSADFEDKKTPEVPESTHCTSAPTLKDLKEYLVEDGKKIHVTTREEKDEEDEREKVMERKAYNAKGVSMLKNTTGQAEEDETLLEPHPHEVDKGSTLTKDGGHINSQGESLPVSSTSEELSQSLTQENKLSTSKERAAMVNASVQTEGGILLHKETQVTAQAEVGTDCPPAEEEDDVVGSEDSTEAATSAQIKKKDEEVCLPIQNEVKKSYAEVVKSGGTSCSKVKQQQPEGTEKKGAAGHSTPKENINSKTKHLLQVSPSPTTPTGPLSAPREKPDKEGFHLVKGRRSSKPRAEKEQGEKKFDRKDVNRFHVLMVDTEDQQESENISDADDNTAPGTEESEREELQLGANCSARATRDQKTRKNRKRASKKKTISSKEGKEKTAWGKPTSTTGSGQASASRQQKDEMKKEEESAVYSLPKASRKLQTKQRPLELSQPPAVSTSLSDPTSFQPPLDSKQTQLKGRYSSKDVGTTDRKKKKSACSKRGKSQSGNISDSKQEEKQVRDRRRPNKTHKVHTAPTASIPRSTRGRESRSRKRTMVDVRQRMRARLKEEETTIRHYRRVQDLGQLRNTGRDQAVRPKQNLPNKLSNRGRLDKPQPKAGQQNTRGFLQTTKPENIAIVTPFEPNALNNAISSQRRRNLRCPDFGTIRIEHNLLSSTSDSSRLPSSLRQDGLYNNMRGRTDHRQSGLSDTESARHWAGGHTADIESRMDSVLTELSALPDQNISPTRDTTAPNEDITMPHQTRDDVSYIGQEAEQLEDSLMYVLPGEEDADEAPEGEMSEQAPQPRTLCRGNTSDRTHSTHDPSPSLGSRDPSRFQRQGASVRSAREELNSQGSGQVSSPRRSGRSPSEAAGPTRSVQNASHVAEADHHGGRPPEVGHVTPSPRIGGTNSWQGLSRYTDPRDLPEFTGRIASCDGARPVCRVEPIQKQVPVCSCNSIPANQLDQEHIFSPSPRIRVLNHAGQHLCTRGSPSPTPVQEFARSIHSTVFRELVLTSFTLRCPHNNPIPWNTMLGYQDTTVQVFPADRQASWTWRIVKRPDGRCEEEHI